jgi:tetratricopeptide (TPR) repeat protein
MESARDPMPPEPRDGGASGTPPAPEGRLFGRLLLRKGYVRPEQLEEAHTEEARLRDSGTTTGLAEILIRKGYLTPGQAEEVARLQGAMVLLVCERCGGRTRKPGYDPSAVHACKRATPEGAECGGRLRAPGEKADGATSLIKPMPQEARAAAADPKRVIGKYILTDELGRGGMGTVYRAWDTALGRVVAVKLLRLDEGSGEDEIRRFNREAQAAACLSHPNVATIYDMGETGGRFYIAMQYIEGTTAADRRYSWKTACSIVRDIALAVEAAHRENLVHRDLKPQNIMIDRKGKPYLLDFGLAKALKDPSRLTQSNETLGTPSYMSPEQAQGHHTKVGRRSDIYSLGATLYAMIAGRPPFAGNSAYDILMRVVNQEPPPLSASVRGVPKDVEAIVQTAMDKTPERRYASARAMADDLSRALKGAGVSARALTAASRWVRALRRRASVLLPTAVAAVLLAGGLLYFLFSGKDGEGRFRANLEQAERHFAAQRWNEALEWYGKASEFGPGDARVLDRIAACKKEIEAVRSDAERRAREAVAAEERERRGREASERARLDTERRRAEAKPHLDRGRQLVENARTDLYRPTALPARTRAQADDAVRALDEAVRIFPDDPEAFFWRARATAMKLDRDAATADYGEAIRLQPDASSSLIERGRLHLERYIEEMLHLGWVVGPAELDRIKPWRDRAEADFRKALEKGAAESRDTLAALLACCENRFADCVALCDRLIARERSREELWKLRGDALHFAMGSFDRVDPGSPLGEQLNTVIRCYDEALKCRANYYEALIMRGHEHQAAGDQEKARADFERALAMRPEDPLGLWFLARWHIGQGEASTRGAAVPDEAARRQYERGLELLARGLALREDSYILQMNHAVALGNLGRIDEALKGVWRALELNASHYFAWYLKGGLLSRQGKAAEGLQATEAALRLNPRFASAWFNAGALYRRMDRRTEARRAYQNALDLGHPAEKQIREALRELSRT